MIHFNLFHFFKDFIVGFIFIYICIWEFIIYIYINCFVNGNNKYYAKKKKFDFKTGYIKYKFLAFEDDSIDFNI